MKHGQASSEYLPLLAVVLLIALAGIYLLGNFSSGMSDVNIAISKGYWKSASPLRIDDWAVKGTESDPAGNGTVQLAMVMSNPTENAVVLRKILVSGMNFTQAYSKGVNFAGKPDDLAPIIFAPGETNTVVIIQLSGPAVRKSYEIGISFLLEDQNLQRSEEGLVPLRGRAEYVSSSSASSPPGLGCSIGQTPCNQTGTPICCSSSQICTLRTMCCNPGQVACGGSCCTGSCQGSTCVTAGYYVCGVSQCAIGQPCCNGVCGSCPDYAAFLAVANSTSLQDGQSARINFTTKNSGGGDAGITTYTVINRVFGGVPSLFANYTINGLIAGTNATNSTTFTCNAASGYGGHDFDMYADNTSALQEADEANNVLLASITISCANPTGTPDLAITELGANYIQVTYGQTAAIRVVTKNIGDANAGASNTTIESNISSSAVSPSSFDITSLSAGLSQTKYAFLICNAANAGSHRISAFADNESEVAESNESNNANSSLVVNCSAIDLNITGLDSTPVPPISAGATAVITITLKNSGSPIGRGNWTVIPDVSVDPNGGTIGTTPVIVVPWDGTEANGTFNFTCDGNLSVQTDYIINVSVPAMPEEVNFANNIRNITISCAATADPDLEMLPLNMTQSILNPLNNKVKNIGFSMKNSGGIRGGNWSVTPTAGAVPPGGTFGIVPTVIVQKDGTASGGIVDFTCPNGLLVPTLFILTLTAPTQIDEVNGANNAKTLSLTCYPPSPDIQIESLTAIPPSPISVNTATQVDMLIKNIGDLATGAFNVQLTDTPASGSFAPMPTISFPAGIDANSQTIASFSYICGATPGTYIITTQADVVAGEWNSTNNVLNISIVCNPANTPDLDVSSITSDPEKPVTGQDTLVQVWVRNVGTAASGNFNVALSASGGNLSVNTKAYASIAAGAGPDMQSVTYTCPAAGGTYNIIATADTAPGETNTANNARTLQITCTGVPDLHVMSLSGTTPIYVNNSTTINIPIRNIGSQALGAFTISITASGGTLISPTSQSYSSIAANSGPVYRSVTFTCPAANGTYTINASAPAVNGEIATANNWNITNITCMPPIPYLRTTVVYSTWWDSINSQTIECFNPQTCFINYGEIFQFVYVTCNVGQVPSTVTTITRRTAVLGPGILTYGSTYDRSIPPLAAGACTTFGITEDGVCPLYNVEVGISIYSDFTDLIEGKPPGGFEPGYGNYFCIPP